MEFAEVLKRRRMIRNYDERPIATDILERVVRAGRKAPSAGFSQGHTFIVVTDEDRRRQIAALAGEDEYVAGGFDPWISRAPALVIVCISEAAYHRRYQEPDKVDEQGREIEWTIPYWWVDAGAALMLILLAAVDEGLGAGFLGVHSIPGLRDAFGIPEEVTPIGVVTLGYAAPDRRSGSLARGWKPEPEAIHWQRW
ncbi:MAG TPA: nitroreductase family protein [Acidimicrobiia bacterium]|jgi:nitroreductase